jgi:hypothetical protein
MNSFHVLDEKYSIISMTGKQSGAKIRGTPDRYREREERMQAIG